MCKLREATKFCFPSLGFTFIRRFAHLHPSQEVREHSAFLFQDEQLFGNLTVREHLLFQCRFRMGRLPKSECVTRSDALITELGLAKCKNTLIGAIGAGISGGANDGSDGSDGNDATVDGFLMVS